MPLSREISPSGFPRTRATLDGFTQAGEICGATFGVWRADRPHEILTGRSGSRRTLPSLQSLDVATPFDLASLTKVLSTATLFARLVDRGWLGWEMPVQARLPHYPHPGIKMRHLLAHTSGLPAWAPYWQKLLARTGGSSRALAATSAVERQRWLKDEVFATAPEAAPDERMVYSDLSFLLLGWVIEATLDLPLDHAVKKYLWNTMGVEGLHYRRTEFAAGEPGAEEKDEEALYAATEDCPWRKKILQGEVHDDNCWSAGGFAGHAGVFGDVESVLRFAAVLCRKGILTHAALQAMWSRPTRPPGCPRTLGWDLRSGEEPSTGKFFSSATVGHLGFTGTSLWIDLEAKIAISLLTNRVHPSRENLAIRRLRPLFHDAIREDLRHPV